jgi:hypothetical protein
LLPILRSRTQAGVLTVLLLNPELELTQTELARRVGASLSSVVDEIHRLEQAGLLSTRTLGRARLVRAGSGPLVDALAEVILRAFGPLQIIAEEFGTVVPELDATVSELALFGSWAARKWTVARSTPPPTGPSSGSAARSTPRSSPTTDGHTEAAATTGSSTR